MKTIQPDILWQALRENAVLPEEDLILAILKQAWLDANLNIGSTTRAEARSWFFSEQFEHYCDLLDIEFSVIQTKLKSLWNSQK